MSDLCRGFIAKHRTTKPFAMDEWQSNEAEIVSVSLRPLILRSAVLS